MKLRLLLLFPLVSGFIVACESTTTAPPSTNESVLVPAQAVPVQSQSTQLQSVQPIAQIISPNAYKVPYLGYDGMFILNADQEGSLKDPRNPKRIGMSKMETVTFYKNATGQEAIARNCEYTYMGAAGDPKYYKEFKASWDLFELVADEKQDSNCKQFRYLTVTAPHGEPAHMHVRYGGEQSSFEVLLKMSGEKKDEAKFSPWFATYCAGGKSKCGKG